VGRHTSASREKNHVKCSIKSSVRWRIKASCWIWQCCNLKRPWQKHFPQKGCLLCVSWNEWHIHCFSMEITILASVKDCPLISLIAFGSKSTCLVHVKILFLVWRLHLDYR
jgi:hypothetical protein